MKIKSLICLAFLLTFVSCQSLPQTVTPAITGAAGAYIGHEISDGEPVGALIGAATGAAAGTALNYWTQDTQRKAYTSGYQRGQSDEVKRLYWASKRIHEGEGLGETFHRGYYEIPVPEHVTSDGVVIDAHTQVVEVIEP